MIFNKETIIKMAVIVLTCLVFALLFNRCTQNVPLFGYTAPYKRIQPETRMDDNAGNEDIFIGYEEVIACIGNHDCLIVDTRSLSDYNDGHIPGAVLFPVYEFDEYFEEFISSHPPYLTLVLYCFDIHCDMSKEMYQLLVNTANYEKILIYSGGYLDWIERYDSEGERHSEYE